MDNPSSLTWKYRIDRIQFEGSPLDFRQGIFVSGAGKNYIRRIHVRGGFSPVLEWLRPPHFAPPEGDGGAQASRRLRKYSRRNDL